MTRQTAKPLERLPLSSGNQPITQLARYVETGKYVFDESYQRGDVWTEDQRIALVYSLLLGMTIPSLIVSNRGHGRWTGGELPDDGRGWHAVIDGRQRLTTVCMWLRGDLAVPKSWFPTDEVLVTEDTDDGPYVRFTGLSPRGQDRADRPALLVAEGDFDSVADEARIFELINGGGTPQTAENLARAARVAKGG